MLRAAVTLCLLCLACGPILGQAAKTRFPFGFGRLSGPLAKNERFRNMVHKFTSNSKFLRGQLWKTTDDLTQGSTMSDTGNDEKKIKIVTEIKTKANDAFLVKKKVVPFQGSTADGRKETVPVENMESKVEMENNGEVLEDDQVNTMTQNMEMITEMRKNEHVNKLHQLNTLWPLLKSENVHVDEQTSRRLDKLMGRFSRDFQRLMRHNPDHASMLVTSRINAAMDKIMAKSKQRLQTGNGQLKKNEVDGDQPFTSVEECVYQSKNDVACDPKTSERKLLLLKGNPGYCGPYHIMRCIPKDNTNDETKEEKVESNIDVPITPIKSVAMTNTETTIDNAIPQEMTTEFASGTVTQSSNIEDSTNGSDAVVRLQLEEAVDVAPSNTDQPDTTNGNDAVVNLQLQEEVDVTPLNTDQPDEIEGDSDDDDDGNADEDNGNGGNDDDEDNGNDGNDDDDNGNGGNENEDNGNGGDENEDNGNGGNDDEDQNDRGSESEFQSVLSRKRRDVEFDPFSILGKKITDARTASRESSEIDQEQQEAVLVNTDGDDEKEEEKELEKDGVPFKSALPKKCRYEKVKECDADETILLKLSLRTFFNRMRCDRRIRVPCSVYESSGSVGDVEKEPKRQVNTARILTAYGRLIAFGKITMDDRTASRESPRRELVNTGGNDEEKEEKDEVPLFDAIPKGCRYKKDGECEANEILLKLSLRTFFNLRRCERRIRVPCSVFEDVEKEPQRLVNSAGALTNLDPFSALGTKIKNARIASQESTRKEQQENGSADGVVDQEDGVPSYSEIPRGCRYREDGECDPLSGTMLMRRVRSWGWRCPRRIRVTCTLDKSKVEVDKGDGEDITALDKALNNDPAEELNSDDGETMNADDETAGTSEERQLLVQPQEIEPTAEELKKIDERLMNGLSKLLSLLEEQGVTGQDMTTMIGGRTPGSGIGFREMVEQLLTTEQFVDAVTRILGASSAEIRAMQPTHLLEALFEVIEV